METDWWLLEILLLRGREILNEKEAHVTSVA